MHFYSVFRRKMCTTIDFRPLKNRIKLIKIKYWEFQPNEEKMRICISTSTANTDCGIEIWELTLINALAIG